MVGSSVSGTVNILRSVNVVLNPHHHHLLAVHTCSVHSGGKLGQQAFRAVPQADCCRSALLCAPAAPAL
jgi:hypothetical protein